MTLACRRSSRFGPVLLAALAFAPACEPDADPQAIDSQTNWLSVCQIDAQCGDLHCVCGVCTNPCDTDKDCKSLKGTACISSDEVGAIAQCGGGAGPGPGLCMPRCDDSACARGQMCVASVCTPVPAPTLHVRIDPRDRFQVLTGFGASVAYSEADITTHPRKDALYAALFAGLGLDVLRLRNRYGHPGEDDLASAVQLVAAAKTSLGRTPTVFMTSWSPPPALKANGGIRCSGNPDTCTLSKTPAGAFDYAGFGAYWRSALDAYGAAGVVPDFIGIQNNPDWVPTSAELGEACRFLPFEGTAPLIGGGPNTMLRYPGFVQAHTATLAALAGASSIPKILAPETSDADSVASYLGALDTSTIDAVSHHLYGMNPEAPNLSSLSFVGDLANQNKKPIFQTEMQADGFGTAVLIHHTMTTEGASAYLQSTLASSATGPATNTQALVGLANGDFTLQDAYYSMRHFALFTDPGWTRIATTASAPTLLASSWQSPDGGALTVIVVNTSITDVEANLELSTGNFPPTSRVIRTVFNGLERTAELGRLSAQGVLRIPGRAIATIAFTK
jgi:O-glycosyl hydrolase